MYRRPSYKAANARASAHANANTNANAGAGGGGSRSLPSSPSGGGRRSGGAAGGKNGRSPVPLSLQLRKLQRAVAQLSPCGDAVEVRVRQARERREREDEAAAAVAASTTSAAAETDAGGPKGGSGGADRNNGGNTDNDEGAGVALSPMQHLLSGEQGMRMREMAFGFRATSKALKPARQLWR